MQRWELPTAIRKGGESLLLTAFRCVEEESGFRFRVRIGRPVCLGINISEQLGLSYFGIFFECTAENIPNPRSEVPDEIAGLPSAVRQETLKAEFVDWKKLKPQELHPQHLAILEHWASSGGASGSLFAIQSDADQEAIFYHDSSEPRSFTIVPSAPVRPPAESSVELRWIHVSDIHFGDNAKVSRAEKTLVLESLIHDAELCSDANRPDCIFVTGDIAYSAGNAEYRKSFKWLESLRKTTGVNPENVWLVPGNHDIARDVVDTHPDLKALHVEARDNPRKLDDFIMNLKTLKLLKSKLKRYSAWVTRNFKHITSPLDWSTMLTTRSSKTLLVAGLCTVWVSDWDDGTPNRPGIWSNNMFISRDRSLLALSPLQDEPKPDLTLLLTHHPRNWLSRRSDEWLENVLHGQVVVQLCGHVHEDFGGILFPFGANGRSATIVGGAVHAGDELRHSYSWGKLCFDKVNFRWYLGWAPRVWAHGQFTADRTNFPILDDEGYCWGPLG
jgi:predicted MPP superfamily phosphohydrolase